VRRRGNAIHIGRLGDGRLGDGRLVEEIVTIDIIDRYNNRYRYREER
tara:strand:+ start:1242 stop:1382 length:141 start_codon:yes stop_codon:yes gene_type:complete